MKKKTVKKMFLKHIEEQITNGLETIEGGLQVLSGVAVFPDQFSLMVDDSSSSIKQGIGLYKEGGKKRNKGLTEEGIRMVAEAVSQLKKGRDFLKSTLGIDNDVLWNSEDYDLTYIEEDVYDGYGLYFEGVNYLRSLPKRMETLADYQ